MPAMRNGSGRSRPTAGGEIDIMPTKRAASRGGEWLAPVRPAPWSGDGFQGVPDTGDLIIGLGGGAGDVADIAGDALHRH